MPLSWTADQADQLKSLTTDLNTYLYQEEANFITGSEPLSNWDSYVATCQSMGIDQVVALYQARYDTQQSMMAQLPSN